MNSIGNRCVVLSTATRLKANTVFLTALTVAALGAGGWAQSAGPVTVASNDAKAAPAVAGSAAAGSGAAAAAPASPPSIITAADVQALKDALAAQQLEIERLSQQLDRQQAQQAAAQAAAAAQPAQAKQVAELGTAVGPQQDTVPSNGLNLQDTGPRSTNPMESDISIHFRGITITPGGFAEAAFVRRSRALGGDITTPFNSLTMPGASQSQLSEFFGSARQSRPTVYVDGRLKNVELSSYISGDFLSAADTSTATQTNSYSFRLRQAWGQAKFDNGWSFLGGQMGRLVAENKASIAPSDDTGRTNDSRPMTIDPGYNRGFTFDRRYASRLPRAFVY